MAVRGRPGKFTRKTADAILARIAAGESLRRICSAEDMPAESTVRGWAVDDVRGFSAQYARARDMGMDALADETIDIADDGGNDTYKECEAGGNEVEKVDFDHINRSRLRVSARQWYLSKVAPKKYGDKLDVDANVNANVTLPAFFSAFAAARPEKTETHD